MNIKLGRVRQHGVGGNRAAAYLWQKENPYSIIPQCADPTYGNDNYQNDGTHDLTKHRHPLFFHPVPESK